MDIADLIKKIKRDAPLKQVAFSGGEPLLRDDLPEIVCDMADEGLSAAIITNGTLLTDSCLQRFPENSVFEVTLFGTDARLHNRLAGKRVFDNVLESLIRIEKYRCRFVLACVITRQNAHDVLGTIELGISLGADAVMFNRINLSKNVLPIADQIVPTKSMLSEAFSAAEEAATKYGVMVAVSVPMPPCLLDPQEYPHLHFGWCPRGSKEAYYTIGQTGLLRPCNHSSVVLGDLRSQGFAEITCAKKVEEFWAPVPDECRKCDHPLKDSCRGGCPAAADECYGTRSRIDPIVEFVNKME